MFTPKAGTKVKNFVLTTRHVVVVLVYIYVRANECVSGNVVCACVDVAQYLNPGMSFINVGLFSTGRIFSTKTTGFCCGYSCVTHSQLHSFNFLDKIESSHPE
jgi:hypothetical protein